MVKQLGQVVSREEVLAVWQTQPPEGGSGSRSNALGVYVHRLRRKLQDSGLNTHNVRGQGYLLELQAYSPSPALGPTFPPSASCCGGPCRGNWYCG
jgi:hypothetical protein